MIIFSLVVIIVITIILIMRNIFVTKRQELEKVIYSTNNLIMHIAKQGKTKKLVILGSGYSLSIDKQNQIVKHDPLMILPSIKGYSKDTTVVSIFYPFECKGLEEAGKELAEFINSKLRDWNEIILIGHSKCGVCFANAAKWIEPKITIVTVSAPFRGTTIADRESILKKLNWVEKVAYSLIFSNHEVDKNIMPNSEFVENADYSGLQKNNHINVISTCPTKSLNPIDLFLIHMDKYVNGDGIVPKESQELQFDITSTKRIEATHATSLQKSIICIKEYRVIV